MRLPPRKRTPCSIASILLSASCFSWLLMSLFSADLRSALPVSLLLAPIAHCRRLRCTRAHAVGPNGRGARTSLWHDNRRGCSFRIVVRLAHAGLECSFGLLKAAFACQYTTRDTSAPVPTWRALRRHLSHSKQRSSAFRGVEEATAMLWRGVLSWADQISKSLLRPRRLYAM